jgi:N-acetylglucosamine kinase-like BadF-type ATPase
MKELWLAFEGGGTRTRILLADTTCTVLARETSGTSSPLYIKPGEYLRRIRTLLRRVKRVADEAGGRVTVVGLAAPMATQLVNDAVIGTFGPVEFVQVGEQGVALGLHDLHWGVALIAGTGATCAASNARGDAVYRGGFGPQFGDEGSGYWIGREAIATAMRAGQGRGPATALGDRLCAFYEIPHIMRTLEFVERSGFVPGPKVASCVPLVFEAAREGDAMARKVCRAAGTALGRLVAHTVAEVTFETNPVPLAMTGGVFHGEGLITAPLRRVLKNIPIEFDWYPPVMDPTMGLLRHMKSLLARRKNGVS